MLFRSANVSKVVDENGEPLVVYHGNTDTNIIKFTKGKGRYIKDGNYYFSPSKSVAESYATNGMSEVADINDYLVIGYNVDADSEEAKYADFNSAEEFFNASLGGKVYSVFLNIKNPLFSDTITPKIEKPYDGAITIPVKDTQGTLRGEKVRQYIATESNQIKSAEYNIGTFDENNDDIRYREVEENNTVPPIAPTKKDLQEILDSNVNNGYLFSNTSKGRIAKANKLEEIKKKWILRSVRFETRRNKYSKKIEVTEIEYITDLTRYDWRNLTKDQRETLKRKGITKEMWGSLEYDVKKHIIDCIGF